jgi:hypothetical protein
MIKTLKIKRKIMKINFYFNNKNFAEEVPKFKLII